MDSPGIRIISAITGCTLLFLAFRRNKFLGLGKSCCQDCLKADSEETQVDDANPAPKSVIQPGKKKVRFSEDVEEPSGDNVEYRRRHRRSFHAKKKNTYKRKEESGTIEHIFPNNRIALYNGIAKFRSQRATVMTYG